MGRVQVRFAPGARPPSESFGRRSSHWHLPLSRHDRLLAAGVPAADRDHRAPRTLCQSSDPASSRSSAMGRHLLLRRRTAANPRSRRSRGRQVGTRRRSASPPSHPDHPRGARRQARRESCGRSQDQPAPFRFRRRQSARLQSESRTTARRRIALHSHRANSARDERCAARAGVERIGKTQPERPDDQRRPSRTRSFSRQHAHFARVEHVASISSARAECLARQDAHCGTSARDPTRHRAGSATMRSATWPVPASR